LARTVCSKQVRNVVRSNKFSHVAAWTEEFPHREAPAAERRAPSTSTQKSKNGIQIIAQDRQSGVVNFRFAVLGGSSSESAQQKGAAHFLAVNAFQGSNAFSGLAGIKLLSDIGASYSAKADREKIVFDVAVLADKVDEVVPFMLANIASPPAYKHVFEENKPQVQLAYDHLHHDADSMLYELIHEAAFGETTGYGSSLFAPNVKSICTDNVLEFRNSHFVSQNIVIAADGISADHVAKLVDSTKQTTPSGVAYTLTKPTFVGGEVKVRTFSSGPSHAAIAWPKPAGEASKASDVLYSLLNHQLQMKGIKVNAFRKKYANGGLFGVTTSGTSAGELEKNFRTVAAELKAIAQNPRAAETRKNRMAMHNFNHLNSHAAPRYLLDSYLVGIDADKLYDVRTVTAQQVSDAAKAVLKATPAYAVYGTTTGTPSLSTISGLFH